jgi:hypothetical protein
VCTRRAKQLTLKESDPGLRRANLLERILFRRRFPAVHTAELESGRKDLQTPSPDQKTSG